MQSALLRNKSNLLFLILGIGVAFYLLARTYYVDITDDEAWSYYNVKKFWWVETLCSGNTHWFNFAAIKLALVLGFEKAWQLRWFSVLSGLIFLYVVYLWIKALPSLVVKCLAFSFVFLNPYLLEYLTLARGYSAGLCLMVVSLMCFVKSIRGQEKRIWQFSSLFFAGSAAIANFNFFYFFAVFAAVYFYRDYYTQHKFNSIKQKGFYFDSAYVAVITYLVLRALLFIRVCSNDIGDYGGEEFVPSIFYSFIDKLFYGKPLLTFKLKAGLGWVLFVLILLTSFYGLLKFKVHQNVLYFYSSIILLGMLLLVIINKWAFHVLYPTERTTLMFYPLFVIVLVSFMQSVSFNSLLRNGILGITVVLLSLNFIRSFTLSWGYDHSFCHNIEPGFKYLSQFKEEKIGVSSDIYFVFLKYYQHAGYYFNGEIINTTGRANRYIPDNQLSKFDYLVLRPPYNLSYYKQASVSLEAVKFFNVSKLLVVKVHRLND